MSFAAILFDFDGVLVDSEAIGIRILATLLSDAGHPTTEADAMRFVGISGDRFRAAVREWIGGPLPPGFNEAMASASEQATANGIAEVAGATAFVRALPDDLPLAVVSSSSTRWIARHLGHIGLADRFGDHLYSGREHVTDGKPAPDIYLHAARALSVDITRCLVIEDSVVGVRGALASGAFVVGFHAASHCGPDHADQLRAEGVHALAADFAALQRIVSTSPGLS